MSERGVLRQQLGAWAEQQAAQLMQNHGFQFLASNYHSRYGELDLILVRDQELVFVEVKARAQTQYAQAIESVSRAKQDRKSTRLNSSHVKISYAVFCLKK